jgi:hypothetical protein
METSLYLRDKAGQARRLARDSSDPMLQISLRRLAVDYDTRADERQDEEIALGVDPVASLASFRLLRQVACI